MFKRVEKRIKRKKREDELGLDEDMKDILGLNDTDSDESESDEDSEGADQDIEADDNNSDEMEGGFEKESDDEDDDENDDEQTERSLITVEEALKDPIFIVSLDPDIKECIVCPGKLLKTSVMVETHKSSNAHERRFRQFTKLAENVDSRTRASELVVKAISEKKPELSTPSATSKRAEKKRISQEKRKAKREKYKARQRAKVDSSIKTKEPNVLKEDGKPAKEKDTLPSEKQPKPKKKIHQTGDITGTAQTSKKHHAAPESTEPPKKKQKTTATNSETGSSPTAKSAVRARPILPSAKKLKSKPNPISEPPNESPEVIQDLQAQVSDIIKSASSLAKAARARAFGGGAGKTKSPSAKKKKPVH